MHDEVAVLFRATVVSMVPAAPVLPAIVPVRADAAQAAGPGDVVDEATVEEDVVVVPEDPPVDVVAALVVVVGDDVLDEQAPSTHPEATSANIRPPKRSFTMLLSPGRAGLVAGG
jgi:hypothetical protein